MFRSQVTFRLRMPDGCSGVRKARKGRNPQTGAALKIAAKKVPVFKAGQGLKNAVK